jgi:thymidylate kinase
LRSGAIISLEGTEGSGKTTYSRFLAEFLAEQGYPATQEVQALIKDIVLEYLARKRSEGVG